jgi:hypothetical protein
VASMAFILQRKLAQPSGLLKDFIAVSTRVDAGGQRHWGATDHRSRSDGSRWQANMWLSSWHGVVTIGRFVDGNSASVATRASRGGELGEEGADRRVLTVCD